MSGAHENALAEAAECMRRRYSSLVKAGDCDDPPPLEIGGAHDIHRQ